MRWIKPLGALLAALALSGAAAAADWRSDLKVLRVGIVAPLGAARDTARIEPFRAYLESKLGLPVEIVATPTYAALIDAQASARVQYAIHTASSFVTPAIRVRTPRDSEPLLSSSGWCLAAGRIGTALRTAREFSVLCEFRRAGLMRRTRAWRLAARPSGSREARVPLERAAV